MDDADLNALLLKHLAPLEREIMILLMGLKDGRQRTLAEVADHCKLPLDEVARLKAQALVTLREPLRKYRDSL